jgi:hypothetical protein
MITEPGRDSHSRAILIGVSAYEDDAFPPIRAARNSLYAMRDMLTDPALCGWRPEQVTIIPNPVLVQDLAVRLAEIARRTTGLLLVYYVGHGVLSNQGELCLTVTTTVRDHAKISGLRWDTVADDLRNSPAAVRIAILDCCFAGRAIEALGGDELGLADITHVQGAYTLTATTRNRPAHVPPANQQDVALTSFTGEFVNLVRTGIPGKPARLTLGDLYPVLRQRLHARGLPLPNQRGTDTVQQLAFTSNAAAGTEPSPAPFTSASSLSPMPRLGRWTRWAAATAVLAVIGLASVITVLVLKTGGATPSGTTATEASTATGAYSGTLVGAGDVRDVAFSHNGTMVATAGGNNHTVTLWNASTGKQVRILGSCCVVSAVSFSPDDSRIATDGDLFDVATGAHLHELAGGYSAAFSPDGSFLAVASGYDPNLGTQIFDPSTGQSTRLLSNEYASYVAVSPDRSPDPHAGRRLGARSVQSRWRPHRDQRERLNPGLECHDRRASPRPWRGSDPGVQPQRKPVRD